MSTTTTTDRLLAALDEYDAARANVAEATQGLRAAELDLKRACGLDRDRYYDGNELVAAMARRLRDELR